MSRPRPTESIGEDPATLSHSEVVLRQFDAAWRKALEGGPVPEVDRFLQEVPDSERAALQPTLEAIKRDYQRLLEREGKSTLDYPGAAEADQTLSHVDNAGPTGATLDFQPEADKKPFRGPGGYPSVPGYEIVGELGRGGMGVVYKARQAKIGRVVALKMVLAGAHASQEELARFLIEAQAVGHLQHPNIVQIHEVGEHEGLPYFSLEYVDGGNLRQKMGGKPQPVRDAAEMVELLALAMGSAHDHGVIHRDLKPANVLLTSDGLPKITDFGLAKRLEGDSNQTKSGTLMGTPHYMAPEQARGHVSEIGPLVDVYALGVILYEMLTGRTPFVGASIMDTLNQVQTLEPVPPSQLQPKVPVDLETICLKCLQKERHKRYASAEALAQDLHRYLKGEPIEARPVGQLERLWRWCRRNPKVASLTAAVFALLATVAVTSSVLLVKIAQEKAETEKERKAAEDARDLAQRNEYAAKAAEKLALDNAQMAAEQSRLAVDTLYGVVTKVQQQLRSTPANQKLRQELLSDAFAGLEKVVSGKSSPLLNRTRGLAHQHMGDISRELGRTEEALRQYQAFQKIIESMAADDPDNQVNQWNLAVVNEKLGDVSHLLAAEGAIAREYYRKSLALWQALDKGPITAAEVKPEKVKESLSVLLSKQASLALALGDPAEAWRHYQDFLQARLGRTFASPKEALAARRADAKKAPFNVASTLRLGDFAFHLGDLETCRGWYEEGRRAAAEAVKKTPETAAAKQDLAAATAVLGDLELQIGEASKAHALYVEAHALYEQLLKENPANVLAQRAVAQSHYRLGAAFQRLGGPLEADKHYHACLKLRQTRAKEDPRNARNQIGVMLVLARLVQHLEAVELAEKLRASAPQDPGILFFTACTYALCSQVKEPALSAGYAAKAIEALNAAIDNGYKDRVAVQYDPDLEPIRGHSQYGGLVERLTR